MALPNEQTLSMEKARTLATFNSRKLTFFIYGGEEAVKIREAAFSRVENALGLSNPMKLPLAYAKQDQKDTYLIGLAWGKILMEEEIKYKHDIFVNANHQLVLINSSPYGLHSLMFIPTLRLQCNFEQQKYWLPLAESGQIIGAYCQTELGHGTFLRGLETTATFDFETDEFVIHSPTISSTKFWPGGIGYSVTHAILMARLIIKGHDYGPHPFIVQLRSLKDHAALPGIELGDIGLKMAYNDTDNGFARFDHVRIPRTNMPMGNAQVLNDGTYIKPCHDKLAYGTMLRTRNSIAHVVSFQLAQAVTIATRYSFVRRQGLGEVVRVNQELAIISYKSQHSRLLALMSQAFALLFASNACGAVYKDVVERQARDDHSMLPYGHATTAALKAYATQVATDGAEDARRCCGGHGYSMLSGIPSIVTALMPMVTLEGENNVMYLQTARYLLKRAIDIRSGTSVDSAMFYLEEAFHPAASRVCPARNHEFLDSTVQLSIFRHRAARLIFHSEHMMRDSQSQKRLTYGEAWNEHMMALISGARAHIELFVLQAFTDEIQVVEDVAILKVLQHLRNLYALSTIESSSSIGAIGFLEDGFISSDQLQTIRAHVNSIHQALLPDAIALTDAWNFSDACLQSALGMKDGNVYETMLAWARQSPINKEAAKTGGVYAVGYEKYIKPILKAKL